MIVSSKNVRGLSHLALVAASLVAAGAAIAGSPTTDLFNSLGGSSLGNNLVDSSAGSGPLYASFSTTGAFTVTGVDLLLSSTYTSPGGFSVGIYADSATSPGSLLQNLGTFNDSSLSSTESIFTVSLSTPFSLAPSSRYWIGISSDNTSTAWSITTATSGVGVANELYDNTFAGVDSDSNDPYGMAVYGVAVPEPTPFAWSLTFVSTVAFGLTIRRFKRA